MKFLQYATKIIIALLVKIGIGRFPPGHYYSPIPSLPEVKARRKAIFSKKATINGIDLNTDKQMELLDMFSTMHEPVPFYAAGRRIRFDIENDSFSYDDAPILHYMMRHFKPGKIIEIGSGNSSAVMMDTSDLYLGSAVDFTFIDIDCSNLRKILLPGDYDKVRIIEKRVQDLNLEIFARLKANDLLFIDSSHVVKTGSDLSVIIFEILPLLAPGVIVHFHDIRYPFQYPEELVTSGTFWNEAYFLRAFLQNNNAFTIVFWLNYLLNLPSSVISGRIDFLPLDGWDKRFNKNLKDYSGAGGSIYLVKH